MKQSPVIARWLLNRQRADRCAAHSLLSRVGGPAFHVAFGLRVGAARHFFHGFFQLPDGSGDDTRPQEYRLKSHVTLTSGNGFARC